MQKWFDSATFQAVLAALGRGLVMAALAYFGMLIKHVTDEATIIGTVGIVFLIPLSGYLHLVVPAVPATMTRPSPRIESLPPLDPPRPEQSSDHVAAAVQRDITTGRFSRRIVPPVPPVPLP